VSNQVHIEISKMIKRLWYLIVLSLCCGYILSLKEEGSFREMKMMDYVPDPIVQTVYGKVQGKNGNSRDGRLFYEFLGIRYARPPIGELRYEVTIKIQGRGRILKVTSQR
jgi:carboxylesterase family protein